MQNRTYRYFKGKPLYAFGHGLSYTKFTYSALGWPASTGKKENATISVSVTNSGDMDGEEVVQLYITGTYKNKNIRSLRGFQRIFLKKGETRMVEFHIAKDDLSILDDNGNAQLYKGPVAIAAGGCQPSMEAIKEKRVTQAYIRL